MAESIAEKVAQDWVYEMHSWRGRSPEFMQAQVGRLCQRIQAAIDEAVLREANWWFEHIDECSSSHPAVMEHMAKIVGGPTSLKL